MLFSDPFYAEISCWFNVPALWADTWRCFPGSCTQTGQGVGRGLCCLRPLPPFLGQSPLLCLSVRKSLLLFSTCKILPCNLEPTVLFPPGGCPLTSVRHWSLPPWAPPRPHRILCFTISFFRLRKFLSRFSLNFRAPYSLIPLMPSEKRAHGRREVTRCGRVSCRRVSFPAWCLKWRKQSK